MAKQGRVERVSLYGEHLGAAFRGQHCVQANIGADIKNNRTRRYRRAKSLYLFFLIKSRIMPKIEPYGVPGVQVKNQISGNGGSYKKPVGKKALVKISKRVQA